MSDDAEDRRDAAQYDRDLTLWEVAKSVMWAFLGVQKDEVRRRDLSRGKPIHFILVGLAGTVLFILIVSGVVSLVLRLAGT